MILLLLVACGADPADVAGETGEEIGYSPEDATCDRTPALDWNNFGDPFFTRYCTSCHSSALTGADRGGAPEGVDFDAENQAIAWSGRLEEVVLGAEPTMPPGGGPTESELAMLTEWIGCAL